MEIINYKFADFLSKDIELINDYMIVLNCIKPLPNFKTGIFNKKMHGVNNSLTELTWGQVNKIKRLSGKRDLESIFEMIATVYDIKSKDVPKMNIIQFYGCVNFISKEIKQIHRVENHRYKIIPDKYDDLKEQAGIEEFEKFGEFPIVDQISGEKPWDYDKVENQPYMTIHTKLWYDAVKMNFEIKMNQLIEPKK